MHRSSPLRPEQKLDQNRTDATELPPMSHQDPTEVPTRSHVEAVEAVEAVEGATEWCRCIANAVDMPGV